jgi:hypothetical protein
MNEELKKDVVTINEIQDKENQIVLKTDKGYFSFFKVKKDGSESRAYESIKQIAPDNGDTIVISYKENDYNGKIFKNAVMFFAPRENDYPSVPRRKEDPQTRNDVLMKLAENQGKLDAKIQELEKRIEALEGKNVSADDLETMFGGEVRNPDTGGVVPF